MDQFIGVGTSASGATPTRLNQCILHRSNEDLADNDKSITVPTQSVWELLTGRIEFISKAAVGNRQLCLEITDNGGVVYSQMFSPNVQAENLTWQYIFTQHGQLAGANLYTVVEGVMLPTSLLILQGFKIRMYDIAGINAVDDLKYYWLIKQTKYDVR